jgi:hypothetical protein
MAGLVLALQAPHVTFRRHCRIELFGATASQMTGTSCAMDWSRSGQELSMRAIVERVIRAFTLKNPPPGNEPDDARRSPAEFAAELLENYRAQLLQRTQFPRNR